jgi:uncharacterized protein YdiU (UPF0061 family)
LALIATPEAVGIKSGRHTPALVLHIAQSSVSLSMIEHFLYHDQYQNAQRLIDYAQERWIPNVELGDNYYFPCESDDDDDDGDDDEYCYRSGVEKFFAKSFKRATDNIGTLGLIPYVDGIFTTSTLALDGTILDAQFGCK